MEDIKQTLEILLKDLKVRQEKMAGLTPEILVKKNFSNKESAHIQVNALKNGIVYFKVDSSTWLYYFNLHKKELLLKFSTQNNQIKDLKFSLGEISHVK